MRARLLTPHSSLLTLTMVTSIVMVGCGYRPASQAARALLPQPVYVDVKLSGVEPQNGVYLKEEIIRVLTTRFHEKVVSDRASSATQIVVPDYSFSYSPLTYDDNGYVTRYRISSAITFRIHTPKESFDKVIRSSEDVSIQSSSLTSSVARDAAIRVAIRKAMDKLIAFVAQKGYRQ
ncbi:LPS assembly lipoprotein LptE [Nitratifractor sp.]